MIWAFGLGVIGFTVLPAQGLGYIPQLQVKRQQGQNGIKGEGGDAWGDARRSARVEDLAPPPL